MNYERCYRSGCYFNMPASRCPQNWGCTHCNPPLPPECGCPTSPCCGPLGCGYLNIALPIGLLLLAGGFLIGQNCGQKRSLE